MAPARYSIALFVAVIALAARAFAQGPNDADEARRTKIYGEGVEAAAQARWTVAKERFAAALAIRASPKVFFSLAQAEERLHETASAQDHFRRALEGAKAVHETEVASLAEQALASIESRVPHLRVVVENANDATATLDGRAVALGTPVPVDPGKHQVVVTAPHRRTVPTIVAIGEGQQLDVPVHLEDSASPPPPPPPQKDEGHVSATHPGPWRPLAVVIGGVGLIGLGLGAGFGLTAIDKNNASNAAGCVNDVCPTNAAAIRRDAVSWASASDGAFIAGALLVAGGVVLWLVAPSTREPKLVGSIGVAPLVDAQGGGLVLRGTW